jgi:alpha-ribazole phosphatase
MVRHTSVDVSQGVCYGFSDVSLNSSFEEEATQVKQELEGKNPDIVYTSPLSRCTQLADFCGYPDAIRDDRLKELNFGSWEMKSWMEIDKTEAAGWFNDWLNYPAKDGESYAQMKIRVDAFLDELKSGPYNSPLVFCHGGVIRLAHVYAGIYPLDKSFEFPVEYGQVFEIPL